VTLRNRTVPLPVRAGGLPHGTVRDKRIVTLVYTDMEGSTRLLGSLRDAFLPVLERQRVILGTATAAHGGAGYATGRRRLRLPVWLAEQRRGRGRRGAARPGGGTRSRITVNKLLCLGINSSFPAVDTRMPDHQQKQ
jgi:class 3 adenylate cyclase